MTTNHLSPPGKNITNSEEVLTPHAILQKYWHYPDFRSGQIEIIDCILARQDTLAILPTGGGKSICFQVPALILGLTLVISPLISLMKDQVDQLTRRGIPALFIDSNLDATQMQQAYDNLIAGQYKFIYVSPERLASQKFLNICQYQVSFQFIAIDEAHCLSLWGHDFRPSYLQINTFIQKLNYRPPIAAFTATTTPACTRDILLHLGMIEPQVFQNSFARENLYLNVIKCPHHYDKKFQLIRLLRKHHGQLGIIYCATRGQTEKIANFISNLNLVKKSQAYHGALEASQRAQIQDDFIAGRTQVIVATNAFGMGVDAPHIRFVIHFQPSSNIENYYQEVGRAGRDRERGDCYFLNYEKDWSIPEQFISRTPLGPNPLKTLQRQKIQIHQLNQFKKMIKLKKNQLQIDQLQTKNSYQDTANFCRQNFILNYFNTDTAPPKKNKSPEQKPNTAQADKIKNEQIAEQNQNTSPIIDKNQDYKQNKPETKPNNYQLCGHCDLCTQRDFSPPPIELKTINALKKLRNQLCHKLNPRLISAFILPAQLLQYLAILKPQSLNDLQYIPNFGRGLDEIPAQFAEPLINFFNQLKADYQERKLV